MLTCSSGLIWLQYSLAIIVHCGSSTSEMDFVSVRFTGHDTRVVFHFNDHNYVAGGMASGSSLALFERPKFDSIRNA